MSTESMQRQSKSSLCSIKSHLVVGALWTTVFLVIFLLATASRSLGQNTPQYSATDLGALTPMAINNNGQVAGYQLSGSLDQAIVWTTAGIQVLPPIASGQIALANGINDAGEVSGNGALQGCSWTDGVVRTYGGNHSIVNGINSAGDVAGKAQYMDFAGNLYIFAIVWNSDGSFDEPYGQGNSDISTAEDVNDNNDIVGFVLINGLSPSYGFYAPGGGAPTTFLITGQTRTLPRKINNNHEIVGETSNSTSVSGFYSNAGAGAALLPALGINENYSAFDINNQGTIVGYSYDPNGVERAAIWTLSSNGTYTVADLNTLLPPNSNWTNLTVAYGINDAGDIVGLGTNSNGQTDGFLLRPGVHGIDISKIGDPITNTPLDSSQLQPFFSDMAAGKTTLYAGKSLKVINQNQDGHYVIAQLWTGLNPNITASRAALAAANAAALPTAGYVLLNFSSTYIGSDKAVHTMPDGDGQVIAALRALGNDPGLGFLAIDVEQTKILGQSNLPTGLLSIPADPSAQAAAINRIGLAVNEVLAAGMEPVIYTNLGDWSQITGNSNQFTSLPLWEKKQILNTTSPNFDSLDYPDITNEGIGGWKVRSGRQYYLDGWLTDPSEGTLQVDANVFDMTVFRASNPNFLFAARLAIPLTSVVVKRTDPNTVTVSFNIANPGTLPLPAGGQITSATFGGIQSSTPLGGYGAVPGSPDGGTTPGVVPVTLSFPIPISQKGAKQQISITTVDVCGVKAALSQMRKVP